MNTTSTFRFSSSSVGTTTLDPLSQVRRMLCDTLRGTDPTGRTLSDWTMTQVGRSPKGVPFKFDVSHLSMLCLNSDLTDACQQAVREELGQSYFALVGLITARSGARILEVTIKVARPAAAAAAHAPAAAPAAPAPAPAPAAAPADAEDGDWMVPPPMSQQVDWEDETPSFRSDVGLDLGEILGPNWSVRRYGNVQQGTWSAPK
jgi:hypothetical protein